MPMKTDKASTESTPSLAKNQAQESSLYGGGKGRAISRTEKHNLDKDQKREMGANTLNLLKRIFQSTDSS